VIFVDTSAWFAYYAPGDVNHSAAREVFRRARDRFVTIDYVVDELLTLLKTRENPNRAAAAGKTLFEEKTARIEWVEEADVWSAWQTFNRYRDKQWSFTDCVSYVVMQRLRIKKAFAFDIHFRQFGTVAVLP
jgi:uncharacterized protein